LLSSAALAVPALADKKTPPQRPNVVLIVADDLGAFMLGCYGNKEIRTPNIDEFAAGGVRFYNAYACSPEPETSRTTLLTGRTPAQPGTSDIISQVLSAQGYRCDSSGITLERAGEFLDKQQSGTPFYVVVRAPHEEASEKYLDLYVKTSFDKIGWQPVAPNAAQNKNMFQDIVINLSKFAAGVTALDDQIPPLLKKLDDRGLRDNTLVIFTSTTGNLLGRHGLWGDGLASDPPNMYEEVVNVPLIWNWRGRTPTQSSRAEVVSLYDVLPTICDITGAALPQQNLCGRSLLHIVEGKLPSKKEKWQNFVFGRLRDMEMVRDRRFKLVLRNGGKGPNELFDGQADPRERVNQYDNPGFVTVRDQFANQLAGWRSKYSS
jgi:arylsulfatase A-like enzyme